MKLNCAPGIFLVCLLVLLAAGRAGAVVLVVEEPSGLDRLQEPVTCGVPLPRGFATDPGELTLLQGEKPVPVEVRAVSRRADSSLSWVHLDFQQSVKAGQSKRLRLEKGPRAQFESKLRVEESEDAVVVETGMIRARVARSGFNVLDQVRTVGRDGGYTGLAVMHHRAGIVAWQDSLPYRSSHDEDTELVVESSGPMRVVLRSSGRLESMAGDGLLHYICRLYFYNDSPVVRMALTLENRDQVIQNKVRLQGLHVEIPTMMRGSGTAYDIGKLDEDMQGVFGQTGSLVFSQVNNSEQVFFGSEMHWEPGEKPKKAKSDRVGWGALGNMSGQVGVAIRYFWQMHPTALVLFARDGFIQAGLQTMRLQKVQDWYAGVARTHYLRFAFLSDGGTDKMRSMLVGAQKPLIARAEPEYYCEETRAFGKVLSRKMGHYPERHHDVVKHIDRELNAGLDYMLELVDERTVHGTTVDSYGYLNWGDGVHYAWEPGVTDPGNLSWNHNYYDLPHMSCLEFARTGSRRWYEYFFTRAHHLMDVHMTHFGPHNSLTGHNRYNPSTEHVRRDPEDASDYTTAPVFVHMNQAHSKTQGMFDRWLLCGDERARDVALQGLKYASTFGGYSDFKQPRGAAHQVLTLVYGYRITGEQKWLDVAKETFDLWWERFETTDEKFISLYFQVGFLLEAFIDYYEVSGDERVVPFVRQAIDWMAAERPDDKFPTLALGAGFVAAHTGDERYIDICRDYLSHYEGRQGNAFKDFAMYGRNVSRALYYLSDMAKDE